ncbi:hypothetical protein [Reyranella sp. CPCC 100927]|uniref:helix-turn-helix transcriptional regulator n=1 Tax=Reyranella sp. CPCC 100927 TaxID=2599616 RepID=UPI0011B77484|nr:hypothetical protein [Reyranella sp. CPCC 100927]TWT01741.1 hypothetical protein FQU96_32185 [Reyranella sp. CPCC 100927]
MARNLDGLVCALPSRGPANVIFTDRFAGPPRPAVLWELGIKAGVGGVLATVLSHLAVAIFLIDDTGCIALANAAAESLIRVGDGLQATNRRLRAADLNADRALRLAISDAVACGQDGPRVAEAVVPRPGRHPLLLSVVPLGRGDHVEGVRASAMAVVMDPEAQPWSRLEGVAQAYGLTMAETRLLAALVDGDSVNAAARRLSIARATAKTHLQHIFAKTFTSRQSELVRLVASTVAPLWREAPSSPEAALPAT